MCAGQPPPVSRARYRTHTVGWAVVFHAVAVALDVAGSGPAWGSRPLLPRGLCLALRGGGAAALAADLSVSTPSGESGLGQWSYESSSVAASRGSAAHLDDEGSSSTGLGIHNKNWSHVKAIGLPVFEQPQFAAVAREARLYRIAADGAYKAQGHKTEEKRRAEQERERRRRLAQEGKEKGWFDEGAGERISGEPCGVCHRILCMCKIEREEEEERRCGFAAADPFERIKDAGIRQDGQDFLPSSSTPSADIEFWDKVEEQGVSSTASSRGEESAAGGAARGASGSQHGSDFARGVRSGARSRDAGIQRVMPDSAALVAVARKQLGVSRGLRDVLVNKTEAGNRKMSNKRRRETELLQRRAFLAAAVARDADEMDGSMSTDDSSGHISEGRTGGGERVAEVASDEVDASDRSQGSFQVRGPSLHGDGRRTSESSATSGLIDDVSLVENELGWAGKQDANPKPTVARRVRSHVTPRAPPDGLAKHGRDDVSKKGVVETRGLEARQQGNAIPRGHQRKTGDVRSKRQDVNRPVHDKRRRVGSGGQVPVNEEKVAGEDIIETLPMDLELDSLEEIDVTRKAELEKRRKEEELEEERDAMPKFVRVYADKEDKIGTKVALEPQPEWVQDFLGDQHKRNVPKRKERFKDVALDLDDDG